MFIYKITNLINNKIYIGKTKANIEERFKQHVFSSKNPKTVLHYAIKKYGINNFKVSILEKCKTFKELNNKERYYIKYHNSIKNGYNRTKGGDGNSNPTKETMKKVSLHHANVKGKNNPNYGKHASIETRIKQSLSHKGKKFSTTTKNKMSIAKSGKNHPMYGKHHSLKTRKKMSLAKLNK